ncbi:MAG TPA: hypothetical protein VG738_16025 [Chitinophagaceae bacterium]|nr:hypothetical protein [Chitinophagaceae bacterium]
MLIEIKDIDDLSELIYECFSGIDVINGSYLKALIESTHAQAISEFIKRNKSIPEEADLYEIDAIQADILASNILKSFSVVFIANNECYALKDGQKIVIFEDMDEFNRFE